VTLSFYFRSGKARWITQLRAEVAISLIDKIDKLSVNSVGGHFTEEIVAGSAGPTVATGFITAQHQPRVLARYAIYHEAAARKRSPATSSSVRRFPMALISRKKLSYCGSQ